MKKAILLAALLAVVALGTTPIAATAHPQDSNAEIKLKPEEYKAFEAIKNAATVGDAFAAAKAFATTYPNSPAIDAAEEEVYVKILAAPLDAKRIEHIAAFKTQYPASKRITELEMNSVDYYIQQGNFAEVSRIGEASLAKKPDDIHVHVLLLRIAVDALKRQDQSLVPAGKKHGEKAIAMFEAPTRPAGFATDEEWTEFRMRNESISYQSMGIISFAYGNQPGAASMFEKAITADTKDPLNYFFLANIRLTEYDAIAQEFNAMPNHSSPEAKKKLDDAGVKQDEAIALLIKTVALSDAAPQIQQTARPVLEEQYKLRHSGKLDGLQDLITKAKGSN